MKREKFYIRGHKETKTLSIRWKGINDYGARIDSDLYILPHPLRDMTRKDLLELKEVIDAFISKTSNST